MAKISSCQSLLLVIIPLLSFFIPTIASLKLSTHPCPLETHTHTLSLSPSPSLHSFSDQNKIDIEKLSREPFLADKGQGRQLEKHHQRQIHSVIPRRRLFLLATQTSQVQWLGKLPAMVSSWRAAVVASIAASSCLIHDCLVFVQFSFHDREFLSTSHHSWTGLEERPVTLQCIRWTGGY